MLVQHCGFDIETPSWEIKKHFSLFSAGQDFLKGLLALPAGLLKQRVTDEYSLNKDLRLELRLLKKKTTFSSLLKVAHLHILRCRWVK